MKEEMQLVQDMEDDGDRDSEKYVDQLEQLLDVKSAAIDYFRAELNGFQKYRAEKRKEAELTSKQQLQQQQQSLCVPARRDNTSAVRRR
jgi:hypothetical protein